jgi:hypothetical protein
MPGQRAEDDASGFADDSCPCNAYVWHSVAREPRTSDAAPRVSDDIERIESPHRFR